VEIVRRMKEESDVPIRSHGSLSLNRALMAAGLVDRIQITVFPVIAAQTGTSRSSRVPATSTSTNAGQRATGAARCGTQLEDHRHRAFPQFSWVLLP
jgi:dihydrofolate reductase